MYIRSSMFSVSLGVLFSAASLLSVASKSEAQSGMPPAGGSIESFYRIDIAGPIATYSRSGGSFRGDCDESQSENFSILCGLQEPALEADIGPKAIHRQGGLVGVKQDKSDPHPFGYAGARDENGNRVIEDLSLTEKEKGLTYKYGKINGIENSFIGVGYIDGGSTKHGAIWDLADKPGSDSATMEIQGESHKPQFIGPYEGYADQCKNGFYRLTSANSELLTSGFATVQTGETCDATGVRAVLAQLPSRDNPQDALLNQVAPIEGGPGPSPFPFVSELHGVNFIKEERDENGDLKLPAVTAAVGASTVREAAMTAAVCEVKIDNKGPHCTLSRIGFSDIIGERHDEIRSRALAINSRRLSDFGLGEMVGNSVYQDEDYNSIYQAYYCELARQSANGAIECRTEVTHEDGSKEVTFSNQADPLPPLVEGDQTIAMSINSQGVIAGTSGVLTDGYYAGVAVVWTRNSDGTFTVRKVAELLNDGQREFLGGKSLVATTAVGNSGHLAGIANFYDEENGEDFYFMFYLTPRSLFSGTGDTDCGGNVDFDDIDSFIQAIIDSDEYRLSYFNCDASSADTNNDGLIDFNDIDAFIEKLIG